MAWTQFMDMNSGGGIKEGPYHYIYIEAPEEEAKTIFYNRFGHNPERVTCTCCGEDYSIRASDSLAQATGYHRNCRWDEEKKIYLELPGVTDYKTVEEYIQRDDVLVIGAHQIKDGEREGDVPESGYVWVD